MCMSFVGFHKTKIIDSRVLLPLRYRPMFRFCFHVSNLSGPWQILLQIVGVAAGTIPSGRLELSLSSDDPT